MASISNLVLNDGQATPVAKTFNPVMASLNKALWQDRSSGYLIGAPSVVAMSRLPADKPKGAAGSDIYKVQLTVKLPVMEVVNSSTFSGITPAPTVAYVLTGRVEFMIPARSTLQNRKDIQAFVKNLLADAQINSLLQNFEAPY